MSMDFGSIAITTGTAILTIIFVVILIYTVKDTITNDAGLNLSQEAKNDINSTFGYGKLAITFLGFGLIILGMGVGLYFLRRIV